MMLAKRMLVGGLIVLWATAGSVGASAFTLISPDDVMRERAKGDPPRLRGAAKGDIGGPRIELVLPRKLNTLPSPLDIELRFVATAPSKIVRDSFRARYGFFGFDVTDRLTKHANVTPYGILARNAELPAGSHSITIEIKDDRERVGRQTFEFEIKGE